MALNGQGLIEELLEKVLLGGLTQEDALGVSILGGSIGPAHHLQDVGDGVVVVGVQLAVVVLRVHDARVVRHVEALDLESQSCWEGVWPG